MRVELRVRRREIVCASILLAMMAGDGGKGTVFARESAPPLLREGVRVVRALEVEGVASSLMGGGVGWLVRAPSWVGKGEGDGEASLRV